MFVYQLFSLFRFESLPKDSERMKLAERANVHNLTILDNSGKGNCLFEAVESQTAICAKELRKMVVENLCRYPFEVRKYILNSLVKNCLYKRY